MLKLSVSMTKTLSQLLGAQEPAFHLGIRQLERASGRPTEDIRLTNDLNQNRRDCLRQLGLDPDDTTGEELYAALMQRIKEDSTIFESLLGLPTNRAVPFNVATYVSQLVLSVQSPATVMALKSAVAKRLLRQHTPKKALRQLGYRSIDSVLKQESAALIFAAAAAVEGTQWRKNMHQAYRKLRPSDFEQRAIQVLAPDTMRWHKLASASVDQQLVYNFKELGTVVLLPFDSRRLAETQGAPLVVTLLALQAANDIRSASTFLKLNVVRSDFGQVVAETAESEPMTTARLADAQLSWKLIHRHYAAQPDAYAHDLFEPHVQPEDLHWQAAEDSLADLHPRFGFWQTAANAGLVHQGEAVSLNLFDSVLNFCNKLPFEQRIVHYVRDHLWHELLLRYMRSSAIEQSVQQQLGNTTTMEIPS